MVTYVNNILAAFGVSLPEEREEGQGLVEYALIIVLISIAAFGAMQLLGTQLDTVFGNITGKLTPAAS